MSITEKELEQKRQRNEKLREQIASAEATRYEREQDAAREIEAANLDAEQARLEAQLANAKSTAYVATVKEGASGPLDAAKESMELAVAQQKAIEEAKEKKAESDAAQADDSDAKES